MGTLTSFGKYLFAIPFAIFGIMHFMNASEMAVMVPSWLPAEEVLVYITGLAFILAAVSIVIGKKDKLAATLLGVMLIIFVLTMHLPGVINAPDEQMMQMSMSNLLKDLMLGGAAWMYAHSLARD
ncbi:MAG: hypothetical protein R3301_09100 [Saprospiraceae bacterium]|nr:hypothetical protein [Saprospiraceae bacterium]